MLLSNLFSFNTTPIGIVAQVLSIIGATCSFIAFQQKSHMGIMIFKATDSLIFTVSWFLLGNVMAGIMSILCCIRNLTLGFLVKSNKSTLPFVIGFSVIATALAIIFWSGVGDIFSIIGTLLSTVVFGIKSANKVRIFNIPVNVLWLINDILITVSLGGIITESFSMISSVIGLIRFRDNKNEKTE